MTNEEKRAEFIKACEMQGINVEFFADANGVIADSPVSMVCMNGKTRTVRVIVYGSFYYDRQQEGNENNVSDMTAPKPKPVKIPWGAEDFDREQPRFLKCTHDCAISNAGNRLSIMSYGDDFILMDSSECEFSYDDLAADFTLLDGSELYKEDK